MPTTYLFEGILRLHEARQMTKGGLCKVRNTKTIEITSETLENQSRRALIIWPLIFLIILLIPATAWCQKGAPTNGEVLTVEEAVELALKNNLMVQNAELEVQKAGDSVSAARTRLFPELNVTFYEAHHLTSEDFEFKKGVFGTFPVIGPIPSKNTKIATAPHFTTLVTGSASQPLSQLYRIVLRVREREVFKGLTEEELRAQRQKVADQVKELYYGILQTQSALEATEEDIVFLRELDLLVDRYVQAKRALEYESLEVKAKLANAEYEAFTDRNTLATQKEQLNYLLGRDVSTPFKVSPVPDITLPYEVEPAKAEAQALEQRPEVRAAQLNVQRTEYEYSIKKSEYLPEISVLFSYTSNFNIELLPETIATVGIFAKWEFFEWGRRQKELAERSKAILQAKNDLEQARDQVIIDVNSQIRKLDESRVLVRVTELAQAAAREKLRVTLNRYAVQSTLLEEVLKAQSSLADANNDYQQAILDYWTARANLEKALGEE
jgi:outer membrane protein TolC